MKVLMQSRKNLFSSPGGDTIQMLKTKEYIEKLRIKVDISNELEVDLKEYDLVHLFNLIRPQEVYLQTKNAKNQGKKIVLSPIYVSYVEYERKARGGIVQLISNILSKYSIEYLKIFIRGIKNKEFHKGTKKVLVKGYYKALREIVKNVDIFLPNSESEMRRVKNDFNLKNPRYIVVPNAVDQKIFDYHNVKVEGLKQFEKCVLCVGRIEGRKSQLNLVRAVKDLPYKLVFIGKPAPNHIKYYKKIKKEAGDNVIFKDYIPHHKLPQYYKAAKVHALISWMETTGLSSLEAGIMGCNLVITDKGDTKDYFSDYVYYCEPDSIESIREAIVKAYESSINPKLRKHILRNYTWENTAEKTLEAYKKILT